MLCAQSFWNTNVGSCSFRLMFQEKGVVLRVMNAAYHNHQLSSHMKENRNSLVDGCKHRTQNPQNVKKVMSGIMVRVSRTF